MPQGKPASLWQAVSAAGNISESSLWGPTTRATLAECVGGSTLEGRGAEFRNRSVLVSTKGQFETALALIELDGVARRHSSLSARFAGRIPAVHHRIGGCGCDRVGPEPAWIGVAGVGCSVTCSSKIEPAEYDRSPTYENGMDSPYIRHHGFAEAGVHTSGKPGGRDPPAQAVAKPGGLEYVLRHSPIRGIADFSPRHANRSSHGTVERARNRHADFLVRAGAHGVTHISGTPSHWRRALMSTRPTDCPQYVRLSGEIADQAILNNLDRFTRKRESPTLLLRRRPASRSR